jgi:phosphoenolpyruvate synthase/pyruvate phosphate dikinase
MDRSILQRPWTKVWTTEYSLITVWLFGREFTEACKAELGFSFDHFIVAIEGNLATGFRSDPEVKRFAADATERIIHERDYLDTIIRKMFEIKQEIEKLFLLPPLEVLQPAVFRQFINLHNLFLPYFIIPLRAPDAFSETRLSQQEIGTLFEKCKVARLATEHFYKEIEKFLQKLFKYAASGAKIDENLLRVVTPDEFVSYLESGSLPAVKTLKERYQYLVVVTTPEKNELVVGDLAHEIIQKITNVDTSTVKEFKGVVANKGVARGIVRIIFTEEDMAKFKGGDILVSPMTRPEFLPVMQNSAAYVTDAGGLLCHAAIVARELNKPCIISTKFATQVLKDGDEVEVDADKGVVRKL